MESKTKSRTLFIAISIAWILSYFIHAIIWVDVQKNPSRYLDTNALLFWSFAFYVLGWLIFQAIIARSQSNSSLFKPAVVGKLSVVYSILAGFLVYFTGIALGGAISGVLIYSIINGVLIGLIYFVLLRIKWVQSYLSISGKGKTIYLLPLLIYLFINFAFPFIFENATLKYFDNREAHDRIIKQRVNSIQVGDTYSELKEKIPGDFFNQVSNKDNFKLYGDYYTLIVEEGKVKNIEIKNKAQD